MTTPFAVPTHPSYKEDELSWYKWRLAYEGGRQFINKFLERYSKREDETDFVLRKKMTYCPAFAKAAIMEIKNSIFERMSDIVRVKGPQSYQEAVAGVAGGVDFTGCNMTSFIGTKILPELLVMRRVGVFIDKEPLNPARTRADDKGVRPYLYVYKAEDIISWAHDCQNRLISVLLRSYEDEVDETTGLICGQEVKYRLLRLLNGQVTVAEYDKDDGAVGEVTILDLDEIPFVIFEMTESLMADIADYQIALMNLESSDIAYLIKSNFPFYTEQFSPLADTLAGSRQGTVTTDDDGNKTVTVGDQKAQVETGPTTGRRYPKGLERPGFINPSSEPMTVSMAKQTDMKSSIRQLVQLALSNLSPTRASGESKQFDQQGLEAGLAYIGLELETGENKIAKIWAKYEGEETALVAYPEKYSLKTESERISEAEMLSKNLYKVPSLTYQKIIAQRIAFLTVGRGITLAQEQTIIKEIDAAEIIAVDPDVLIKDMEAGLVAAETASQARGYPKGDVAKAKQEHIDRLAAIAIAQSKGGGAARGIPTGPQDNTAALEKTQSQDPALQDLGGKGTRGTAQG
jgi:hypothetical protein